jgi:hypothetical protein
MLTLAASGKSIHIGIFNRFAYFVDNRDRAVLSFGSADDSQAIAVKRMERIEYPDVCGVCTQGIVRDDGFIRMSTV